MSKIGTKCLIITTILSGIYSVSWASSPTIRVQVLENAPQISVYAKELSVNEMGKDQTDGEPVRLLSRTTFSPGPAGLNADGKKTGWQRVKISSENDRIWLNGTAYRGDIIINKDPSQGLTAINILPLEKYVAGTLAAEMPQSWPLEALKAQAVTARTYALYVTSERRRGQGNANFDIKSTIEDQVYKGSPYTSPRVNRAIDETEGEILSYHDKPVKTRFHSSCGGQTETSIHVWGEKDISKRIKDPYCKGSPHNSWQTALTSGEISAGLRKHGFDPGEIRSIKLETFDTDRVAAVSIHGTKQTISLTGNDFRRYMGFGKIKSTLFTASKHGSRFKFTGRGFGHGVGMCQWGAKGMAERGYSYKDILNFYYPGTVIRKIY